MGDDLEKFKNWGNGTGTVLWGLGCMLLYIGVPVVIWGVAELPFMIGLPLTFAGAAYYWWTMIKHNSED